MGAPSGTWYWPSAPPGTAFNPPSLRRLSTWPSNDVAENSILTAPQIGAPSSRFAFRWCDPRRKC